MQNLKLSSKKCKPCEGGTEPMDQKQIQEFLKLLDNWTYLNIEEKIEKNYIFKDFQTCIQFIQEIAKIAESEGHHPDILLYNWNNIKISLKTHSIKGLSENDFILAAKIDLISHKFTNKNAKKRSNQ